MRVSFLGPEGTFSEEALLASVPRDHVEPVPEPSIYDCVVAVQRDEADRAFVPIENSIEGSVNATLDALVFETDTVRIVGEYVHPIEHCLIGREGTAIGDITRVVSHPQPSGQCATFLREQLPGVEVVAAASTADAVKLVADSSEPWAALGTRLAAELYGCVVLRDRVEDSGGNETRFIWLANPNGDEPPARGERLKTSIVFWGLPDSPGALVDALKEFADRGINLSKIESRPLKKGLGSYMFFADLECAETDPAVVEALAALRKSAETTRVLGCYPAA